MFFSDLLKSSNLFVNPNTDMLWRIVKHSNEPLTAHLTPAVIKRQMMALGLSLGSPVDEKQFLLILSDRAKEFHFAPYSNFQVGAAAWLASGDIVLGSNLELGRDLTNAIHAEQSLIVQAMSLGQEIVKIAVNHPPCGCCRQSLIELSNAAKIQIYFGENEITLAELLPLSFSPIDLGQKELAPHHPKWQLVNYPAWNGAPSSVIQLLQDNLALSYAPRTQHPAAVVFETTEGLLFAGRYIENAAFNPSISALKAAMVNFAHSKPGVLGTHNTVISNVWLAQRSNAPSFVDHIGQTKNLLESIEYNYSVYNSGSIHNISVPMQLSHVSRVRRSIV